MGGVTATLSCRLVIASDTLIVLALGFVSCVFVPIIRVWSQDVCVRALDQIGLTFGGEGGYTTIRPSLLIIRWGADTNLILSVKLNIGYILVIIW